MTEIPAAIILSGLLEGSIYSLLALGVSLVIGVMRIAQVVHGDLMILAALVSFWLFNLYRVDPFLSLVITLPLLLVVGMIVQKVIVEPGIKDVENYMASAMVITYGLAVAIEQSEFIVWTPNFRTLETTYESAAVDILGVPIPVMRFLPLIASISVAVLLYFVLTRTYFGKALSASKDDREAAVALGVNFGRISAYTFGISSVLAALAGLLYILTHITSPAEGFTLTIYAYVALILGGLGSIFGPLIAGLVIGVVANTGSFYLGGTYHDTIAFLILLLILLIRPTGIFGKKEI